MKWRMRIAWSVVGVLVLVAFASGLIAVWEPSDSHARAGWGGTAVMCGIAAFVCFIVAGCLSADLSDTEGPCP